MDSYLIQYFMPNNSTPIKEEQNTNLIQDGTILFLKVGDVFIKDDGSTPEEAPATENLSKVRIFYGSTNGLNVDAIKVTLFTYPEITIDPIEDLSSFVLKKGELSPYFVIDLARYENTLNEHAAFGFIIKEYDLSTQTEGRVIASGDGSTDFMPDRQSGDPSNPNSYKMKYKFMTYQLFSDYAPQFVMGKEW